MPFDSAQDAENFRRLIEDNHGHLAPTVAMLAAIAKRTPLVQHILAEHIKGLPSVTARSRADYTRDARLHIEPHLGRLAIDKLTPAAIKEWLKVLSDTEMSDKTIANIHGLLSAAVTTYLQTPDAALTVNPCRGIRLPRRSEHEAVEMTILTQSEWAILDAEIGQLAGGWYLLFFRTLIGTGMRWGEATALQVADLSLDIQTPSIRITRATRRDENSTRYIGPTKTKRSRRSISIADGLARHLTEHVKGKSGSDLIFTSTTGNPVHHSNVRNRIWLPAVAAAMDPKHGSEAMAEAPRVHDLRHTHASWLIAAGVDMVTVQRRLGHESITTTVDRYSHLMPGQHKAAADAMSAIFS
jgi:integrase